MALKGKWLWYDFGGNSIHDLQRLLHSGINANTWLASQKGMTPKHQE